MPVTVQTYMRDSPKIHKAFDDLKIEMIGEMVEPYNPLGPANRWRRCRQCQLVALEALASTIIVLQLCTGAKYKPYPGIHSGPTVFSQNQD